MTIVRLARFHFVTKTLLPWSRPLTRADLDALPDDGHRHELIDGSLIVTPVPTWKHQTVAGNLLVLLHKACPKDLELLHGPFDVAIADDTILRPDQVVARRSDFTERDLPVAPLLVVEISTPETRLIDMTLKRARLEIAGCQSYWVVDPDEPSIVAWELRDGGYVEVANVKGEFRATRPFEVCVVPADLIL